MILRIKNLLDPNNKNNFIYTATGTLQQKNFIVNCHNQVYENYIDDEFNKSKEFPKVIAKTELKTIQEKINKVYNLKLDNIIGFQDIKELIREVVNVRNKKKVHLLIDGYPGTAKTVFLSTIKEELSAQGATCEYIDCANLTGAGLMDYLLTIYVDNNKTVDYLLLDEIDKTYFNDQKSMLNMFQTGILKNTKKSDKRSAISSFTTIATSNDRHRIYNALFDRFIPVYIPKYTKEQFFYIGETVLQKKYKFNSDFSKYMTLQLWRGDQQSLRRLDDLAILVKDEIDNKIRISKLDAIITTLNSRKHIKSVNV